MKRPKILLFDIEMAPALVWTWSLFKVTIPIGSIEKAPTMLSFAAKWHGDKKMTFRSSHHHTHDEMIDEMWRLLDEADMVVHFNGTSFDVKHCNREFILKGYVPPSPYKQIDLRTTVKSNFRFISTKLDWVSQQLGIGQKTPHPGMSLWLDCMQGVAKAWRLMKKYNIQDVTLLEELYEVLLPWIKHPNVAIYMEDDGVPTCPNCGGKELQKRGFRVTNMRRYQQYFCKGCGKWPSASKCMRPIASHLTK